MNRSALKTYAPKARLDFIRAVTDRAAFFGLTPDRTEAMQETGDVVIISGKAFPKVVAQQRKKLQERIARDGFDQVMEAMAYTWFNRFVALRYMELHGYLDHGYRVLSPAPNLTTETLRAQRGEEEKKLRDLRVSVVENPEILDHAEHVTLPGLDVQQVINLKLDGTREAELYRLLIAAQCHALHQALPFVFGKIDDETELLLPDNLLHTDSLIRQLVSSSDEADWEKVEILGWLYQFYISDKKDQVMARKSAVPTEDIPAVTQLFTPHWIVRYLVENSLGRLWLLNRPGSRLREHMPYYIEDTAEATPSPPAAGGEGRGEVGASPREAQTLVSGNSQSLLTSAATGDDDRPHPGPLPQEREKLSPPSANADAAGVPPRSVTKIKTAATANATAELFHDAISLSLSPGERAGVRASVETDFLKISKPEDIKLLDPAVGSGHMLTYAFDLLYLIYEEEGYAPTEIPGLILRHNLHGLEICPRAAQLAELALVFKAREKSRRFFQPEHLVRPHIIELRDVRFAENELRDYIHALGLGDLFNQPMLKLLHQFEEAKNFGSLIQPCLDEQNIAFARRAIEAKDLGGQLFLRETHLKVLRVLEQAEALTQRYHVVVANPPYMGGGGMNEALRTFGKKLYEDSKADLFSMFMQRTATLAVPRGFSAMVTMQSWMFLSSFEQLRAALLDNGSFVTLAQIGYNSFPEMNSKIAQACAFVFNHALKQEVGIFVNLNDAPQAADKELVFLEKVQSSKFYRATANTFQEIPGSPIAYWLSDAALKAFRTFPPLSQAIALRKGLTTMDNNRFLRFWHEVARSRSKFDAVSAADAKASGARWFLCLKGGGSRKWFGLNDYVINWQDDGRELKEFISSIYGGASYTKEIRSEDEYFKPSITWTTLTSSSLSMRFNDAGSIFESKGSVGLAKGEANALAALAFTNSRVAAVFLEALSPTLDFNAGPVGRVPYCNFNSAREIELATDCVRLARADWDNFETSWDFRDQPLLRPGLKGATLEASWRNWEAQSTAAIRRMQELETENNRLFIAAYGLDGELQPEVPEAQITLARAEARRDLAAFLSYSVGCMMGRYSLDKPGLIYAHSRNEGFDASQYQTFTADADGIIPITELSWFPDDATERFVEFIGKAWPVEHLEENLKFIADSLGANRDEHPRDTIRRYLATGFYKDHLQTYKKRPIYWLFSSGKQRAFQCLVYLHRYHEGTLARMRTEYVIPLQGKLSQRIEQLAGDTASATSTSHRRKLEKERETLVKQHTELTAFDEKLRHWADQRIALDLDDGVKVNYGKFGDLLAEVKAVTGGTEE